MEILIAAALLGFLAIALLPSVFSLVDTTKAQSFRSVCSTLARAKLQEYINGVAMTSGGGYVPSGFEYTKARYQANQSQCQTTTTGGSPGFRERTNSNEVIADNGGQEVGLSTNMRGFQLYVLLRHYNPRKLVGGQPTRGCPNSDYQFYRLGDAIEVTVTGMIRTDPTVAEGGRAFGTTEADKERARFGKIRDQDANTPNQALVCSATQIIYPPRLPFRYYLGNDGKIRNLQSTIAFSSGVPQSSLEAIESHFRSVWSVNDGSTGTVSSPVVSNIRSFAIAPDNKSVYILKPGLLQRFKNCTDQTVQMTNSSATVVTYQGVPNCSKVATDIDSFFLDANSSANIENIAVDFGVMTSDSGYTESTLFPSDDRVFGLLNTGSTAGDIMQFDFATSKWGLNNTNAEDGVRFSLPANRPRIRAIFIAQNFPAVTKPNLFFVDNSCYSLSGTVNSQWVHCASIFNAGDTNMTQDIRELPSQVEGVSY